MRSANWSDVFASLPDAAFFEVVRNYLGPVSTPFHKPDLTDRMAEFLGREPVVERALEFLDPEDARMLTIVAFDSRPTEENIRSLSPHLRETEFLEKLLNLEERLLVFLTEGKGPREYALTPLGTAALLSGRLGPGTIAGSGEEGEIPENDGWFDDNFLTAALAFLCEENLLFRKEGGWRKRALEILSMRFPALFRDGRGEDRLLAAGRGLAAAGLADRIGDAMTPRLDAWKDLERRDPGDRLALLKARAAAGRSLPIEAAVAGVRTVTEFLPLGRFFDPEKLADLFRLAVGGDASCSPRGARRVVAHLELLGELVPDEKGKLGRPRSRAAGTGPKMTMTPVGDIALNPGMPLFCDLALAADPVASDVAATFRMEKGRFLDGLDRGVDPEVFFAGIEAHTGRAVPANLRTLAREWIAEYESTDLKLAAVFTADGTARHIVDETGILKPYCLSRPAEGVWILDPAAEKEWRGALASVGIERIPWLKTPSGKALPGTEPGGARVPAALPWKENLPEPAMAAFSWEEPRNAAIDGILEELRRKAEAIGLSPEEREIFRERLLRRLILSSEQIHPGAWRYEVMSAKGLDYRGKIRLADAAIGGRSDRLEVTHASGNDVATDIIIPKRLEKDGEDHVLTGLLLPEETEVSFKIRKIGFLKRIKTSLF